MAFADWTQVVAEDTGSGFRAELTTDATFKIRGNSSIAYGMPASGAGDTNPRIISGWTAGVTSNNGLVQTMLRRGAITTGSHQPFVFCLMQTSIGVVSECYMLSWTLTTITLWRGTPTQLRAATATQLAQVTGVAAENDQTVHALELKWQYDVASNGMLLTYGHDGPIADPLTYDYSTIVKDGTYTDSPPLIDGVTAGIGWAFSGGVTNSGTDILYTFDGTEIFYP